MSSSVSGLFYNHHYHHLYHQPILFADPRIPFQYYLDQIASPYFYASTNPSSSAFYSTSIVPPPPQPPPSLLPQTRMNYDPVPPSMSPPSLPINTDIRNKNEFKKTPDATQIVDITQNSTTETNAKVKWRREPKKYRCDLCNHCFSRSNTLVTHKRIHTGEKPFKCDQCGRYFRQHGNLTRHLLTHTDIKPYSCQICNRAFNRRSNLKTHTRIHRQQI
ncbi:zinc finger protein 28-like [Argonauta hians]